MSHPVMVHAGVAVSEAIALQIEARVRALLTQYRPPGMLLRIQRTAVKACGCGGRGAVVAQVLETKFIVEECPCVEWRFITRMGPITHIETHHHHMT